MEGEEKAEMDGWMERWVEGCLPTILASSNGPEHDENLRT